MNEKCIINPIKALAYNFKHNFSYRLLFHIMIHYDKEDGYVIINKVNLIELYNSNYHSVNNAVNELIDAGVIERYKRYKDAYKVDKEVLVNVKKQENIKMNREVEKKVKEVQKEVYEMVQKGMKIKVILEKLK